MLEIQRHFKNGGTFNELRGDPYNLSVSASGQLVGFKYSMIESDMSLDICQEARGLILERGTWDVVSYPFRKFFNAGEAQAVDIDWDSARVVEKLDGTCCPMYFYQGEWRVHTLGTVEGEGPVLLDLEVAERSGFEGETFADLFWETWDEVYGRERLGDLDTDHVYTTELCTPYNRVVTRYEEPRIVLLGIRNRQTLQEHRTTEGPRWFDKAREYELATKNLSGVKRLFESLGADEEGFVIVDSSWNRVKVKQPSYVLRHRMKDNVVSRKNGVIEAIQQGEADDFIGSFPEFREVFEDVEAEIERLLKRLDAKWNEYGGPEVDPNDSEDRKQFALKVTGDLQIRSATSLFFSRLDGEIDSFWEGLQNVKPGKVASCLNDLT